RDGRVFLGFRHFFSSRVGCRLGKSATDFPPRAAFHTPPRRLLPGENPSFLAFSPPSTSPAPGTKRPPGRASGPAHLPNRHPTAMARTQDLSRLFQQPESPAHRHFEVCRAYFLESTPADELARRF